MEGGGSGGAMDGVTIGTVAIPIGNGGAAGNVPEGGAMGIELLGEEGNGTVGAGGGSADMVPPRGGVGATGMVTAGG